MMETEAKNRGSNEPAPETGYDVGGGEDSGGGVTDDTHGTGGPGKGRGSFGGICDRPTIDEIIKTPLDTHGSGPGGKGNR